MIDRIKGPIFDLLDYIMGKGSLTTVAIAFFSVLVVIFVVFPIHECSHGLMASILGDDTAEREGRLTLNPFAHIDPLGAFAMFLCCIGWAKPTPVNITRCNRVKPRTALALTSLAGPVSNILLSYVLFIATKLVFLNAQTEVTYYVGYALLYTAEINVYLAVFNLIPIPPFDGYNILASFLPAKAVYFMQTNGRIINIVFFALLIFGLLDLPLGYASFGIEWVLDKASGFIPFPLT